MLFLNQNHNSRNFFKFSVALFFVPDDEFLLASTNFKSDCKRDLFNRLLLFNPNLLFFCMLLLKLGFVDGLETFALNQLLSFKNFVSKCNKVGHFDFDRRAFNIYWLSGLAVTISIVVFLKVDKV